MLIKPLALLIFLSSCALLKGTPSLKEQDPAKLIDAIKLTGEGKGRLTLGQSKYLFGVDSVLKENTDWILAVTIPFHGEEVMILPSLKEKEAVDEETESFEERIQTEFERLKLKGLSSKQFLSELRSLVRFQLGPSWGQKRDCRPQQQDLICAFDGENYLVEVTDKEIHISKALAEDKKIELVAKNLTDSFFQQTDIFLFANKAAKEKKETSFSLELFW